jgi:hypothetical protein
VEAQVSEVELQLRRYLDEAMPGAEPTSPGSTVRRGRATRTTGAPLLASGQV